MTLADVLTTLEARGALPASRVKDLKTSLKYLAHALGHESPEQCPLDAARLEEARWLPALETHFAALETQGRAISAVTRRNTRNNLRLLFRLAETHALLTTPLASPLRIPPRRSNAYERQQQRTSPYLATYGRKAGGPYSLPRAQWPPDIQAGWETYEAACWPRLRERSLRTYVTRMATYLGYLAHITQVVPTWDACFNPAQLLAFVRWHGARVGSPPVSSHGRQVVIALAAIAKVLKHPQARAVADLRNTLKPPAPMHNKAAHWLSLAQLDAVANACLAEGRLPLVVDARTRFPGLHRTCHFQRGLLLKFLTRVPLRQRNLRELQHKHLYKDHAGDWLLHLRGDDLKVGTRGGQINEYRLNLSEYSPELVALFEEWFRVHRPRLPGAADSPYIFLTQYGKPFSDHSLAGELAYDVGQRLGVRFYPHLVRSIWATEYLEKTQDYATAATMLGDSLRTTLAAYYHVTHRDHHAKAKAFLATALHTG